MKQLTLPFLLLAMLFSCDEEPSGIQNNCPEMIICTRVYVQIGVKLIDQNGNAIYLDTATIENQSTKTTKGAKHFFQDQQSIYYIANDSELDEISTDGTTFVLRGWKDNKKVVEQAFIVNHDCCHVQKLEGPDEITVTLDSNEDCPSGIACTEIFVTTAVKAKDADGNDIVFDSTLVTNMTTNTSKNAGHIYNPGVFSSYSIASDNDISSIGRTGTDFRFQGWIHGLQFVDTIYTIGHDCCHVQLLDGPETIILDGNDCLQKQWCHLVDCAPFSDISIKITNSKGAPVTLDKTEVCARFLDDCRSAERSTDDSSYKISVANDWHNVTCRGTSFTFKGWLGNELVVDEEYKIGKDCCQTYILEGEEVIVLQ